MDLLLTLVGWVTGLVGFVCWVLVLIKMFQNGHTGLAIACIPLTFCCVIGYFIVLIFGWVKAGEWNIKNIMIVWTAALLISIVAGALNPGQYKDFQEQFQKQLQQQQGK